MMIMTSPLFLPCLPSSETFLNGMRMGCRNFFLAKIVHKQVSCTAQVHQRCCASTPDSPAQGALHCGPQPIVANEVEPILREMSLRRETKSTITGWGGTEQSRWNITINVLFHPRARDRGGANQSRMQMRWYITISRTNEQTNNERTNNQTNED